MESKAMNNHSKTWIIVTVVLSVAVLLLAGLWIFSRIERNEITELYQIEKEELEDEYSSLAVQYEGYQKNLSNDSLISQLDTEKMKVQRLLEELRTVKASDAKRINELKKELATLRSVMRSFVIQIDSLNQQNQRLEQENKTVKRQFSEVSRTATQLKKEKAVLTQQVELASKLDAVGITAVGINKRGKSTDKIGKTEQLKFCFMLAKNSTAEPGEKELFIRILKPDDEPLVKSRSDLFHYEDKEINYSIRKQIEYDGEEQSVCMYWLVEEFLYPGTYRVDIFADGQRIGHKTFSLEK